MEETDVKNIIEDLEYLASARDGRMILNILVGNHPADIANLIHALPDEHAKYVFGLLDADTASDVIVELDDVTTELLVAGLRHERLSEIVDEMESDDATDLVAELPEDVAEKVLDSIDAEGSDEVKELLQHEEDTAGGIMALEYVAVHEGSSVDEAIHAIRAKAEDVEEVYNLYVIDKSGILVGFLPLKNLIVAAADLRIRDVMVREIISVPVSMDQEAVANIFRKYNLVSIPVTEESGRLVGRITVDDIVEVMEEEASEDIQKMAGIADEEEIRETSVLKISFGRLPWLLVSFFGELVAAIALGRFEASLQQIFMATFFIPLMMAMGGNSGIQAATIVVRGMALGELNPGQTMKRLMREVRVSLLNGSICGILLLGVISVFDEPRFGGVLALAMLIVIFNASFVGATIPLLLRRIGVDPAIAAGPLITTFNDIVGLSIYLGLVTMSLQFI